GDIPGEDAGTAEPEHAAAIDGDAVVGILDGCGDGQGGHQRGEVDAVGGDRVDGDRRAADFVREVEGAGDAGDHVRVAGTCRDRGGVGERKHAAGGDGWGGG